ncbi:MAG: diaminopimelate epimerase, partial [Lachnospiraceae bacterium]|nr:diaminopimelate epimerase [Lachnospiraceae bacterium]
KVTKVRVDMGQPVLEAKSIPVEAESKEVINAPIKVLDRDFTMTCVSMGNPHAVVPVEDVKGFDIEKYGPAFENNIIFPKRINTEFIKVIDRKTVEMRVWERGSGETFACGTGACAVAVACARLGLTDREVDIKLLGGTLHIEWDEKTDHVYMTGPATTVFSGEIE